MVGTRKRKTASTNGGDKGKDRDRVDGSMDARVRDRGRALIEERREPEEPNERNPWPVNEG